MKEAAGEANMTVITIVLIAIVLGIGTVVVTRMMSSTAKREACNEVGGKLSGNVCTYSTSDGKATTCTIQKCTNSDAYSCGDVVTCPSSSKNG